MHLLQKFQLHLHKNWNGLENAFTGHSKVIIATLSNSLDLQALASADQLPAQNLATLGEIGRPATKSVFSKPF
ncbi:hypothetical protein CQW23_14473 [Capsicum baccatum]|uniref:Uncharacterized protein n=1 Tax=Capsicum baccatum TaxID=33114 RepID=A0A2G2WJ96_CAPBA|nr:hypothetical protein CQW23_14473 [Capsicum baccatum]